MAELVWVSAGAAVLALVIWTGHRTLTSGGDASSGAADALGSFIDVFHPAQARSMREIKRHFDAGPVIPSPDDDDDDALVRLVRGPDGRPRAIRLRRTRPAP
ncbi:hypothetical protein [Nocardioides lijunqiniae]|uniref:hypothetical protein n=1 Tax=Nocardioides lijunqiniae TaxID=2760832 RepID=UPI0018777CE5|nr:hypothetical protein [Nocardioides lijunqiniae]